MTTSFKQTMLPSFQLYSRPEYFQDLIGRTSKLGKGQAITLMTMNFDPQVSLIARLMEELRQAAGRGASVHLLVDAMDFILDRHDLPGPLFYGKSLDSFSHGPSKRAFAQLVKLRENNVKCSIINRPSRRFSNPVAGRSHIKLALIDDRVYLGGCNLDNESCVDLMAAWNDDATAQWLRGLVAKIEATGNVKKALEGADLTYKVSELVTIFVDSGVKKQSVIYQKALSYIDEADKEAYITCQYFPGGPTAQHLLAAKKRGAKVEIIFNGPAAHSQPLGHYLYNTRERSRLPAGFFKGQLPGSSAKLHAKLIATEHGALLGSHNYVDIGVNLGTAEIALLVEDPEFSTNTQGKIRETLGQ